MLNTTTSPGTNRTEPYIEPGKLRNLHALEKKILWLSSWIIHNANHLRPKRDGLKVGGHQASSASVVSILTALFFDVLRPEDRIAIKPHASPVFHAIQYLNGRQSLEKLQNFRAFNGAQAYPSRTKDTDDVDFSTGSEGLGAALTIFSSLVQEYAAAKGLSDGDAAKGRMIAVLGDAELDEGNLYEALLEGWKHTVRNVWWIVDYNRQSLDRVLEDRSSQRIQEVLQAMGWNVVVLKYGKRLQHAFAREGGDALLQWIDNCPNSLYSALVYRGGAAWRERLNADIGTIAGVRSMLEDYDDDALAALMTNLAGHDIESLLEAFHGTRDETSTCFLAYTIKGYGLPFAGHKDNHAALMSVEQMDLFKRSMGIDDGEEWDPLGGLAVPAAELREFIAASPFARSVTRHYEPPAIAIPAISAPSRSRSASTQEGFGRILSDIARTQDDFARRVVTTSPDVTISTNLGGWVNRRGVFGRRSSTDDFGTTEMRSVQKWALSPEGQHIELGIAENNLFLTLTALGLSAPLHNARLLPIGTVYDTFIGRGLDALNYGCYQDARFLLVGTPSGISLAPEGGAHQSTITPLIGIGQPKLRFFEPSYVDEVAAIMHWSFEYMQLKDGGSVYLRLSTRRIEQPQREMTADLAANVVAGGYWLIEPAPGATFALICTGVVVAEAIQALQELREDIEGIGILVVTSSDRLHAEWLAAQRGQGSGARTLAHIEKLLAHVSPDATLVSVCDGHPLNLSWLGSVARNRIFPIGVERFGQSGDIPDIFAEHQIDCDAIVDRVARILVGKVEGRAD
ncbi:1-deoxy-D-xylulose-5-phosphate synthase N-terminal domain-containing protein [Candidatus Binatus sp.]|uniref:1-deoxy-D-xylulose-5-phosphate synthase N-terminal domain-containing protein n=1 Tax=Candidatus Binatus sp. TaxID=2811406 RepID=UPI003BB0CFBD